MDGPNFMQVDIECKLYPLELRNSQAPNPVDDTQQSAWRPLKSDGDQSPWKALPASGTHPKVFFSRDSIPFASRQYNAAIDAIKAFQDERKCDVRLNGETGLPGFLFGDLYPERKSDDNLVAAAEFLQVYQLVIAGRDKAVPLEGVGETNGVGLRLNVVRRTNWSDGTDQIRFQQYSPSGTPIYGAQVVTTFDATGKLAIVSSSLYPALEELPEVPKFSIPAAWWEALTNQVLQHIGFGRPILEGTLSRPSSWIYPQRIYENVSVSPEEYISRLGAAWRFDKKIGLWHFDLDAWLEGAGPSIGGRYVPVTKVWFMDRHNSLWHAILDISQPDRPTLIHFDLEERAAPYLLFPSASTARDYFAALAQPGANAQTLVTNLQLEHDLDFGSGSSFVNADGVKFTGQFSDLPAVPTPSDWTNPDLFRAATVFYHLQKAQTTFKDFLDDANIQAPDPSRDNPLNEITVEFDNQPRTPAHRNGRIRIGRSYDVDGNTVREPGLDPEVVVHEFAHAVAHYYFRDFFNVNNDPLLEQIVAGFDEGQAFYLSTVVFGDAQWSEYAYAPWSTSRNLDSLAGVFHWPNSLTDSFSEEHGLGVWLGRLFWQIHSRPDLGRSMNYLLFRALGDLARGGLSNHTPDEDTEVQLKGMLSLIAKAMYVHSDSTSQQIFLQQVFSTAGLSVP